MATNYPSSLDTFDSIASDKKTSDVVGGRTHRDMHNDLGDALEAVQAELGTDPAGAFSTVKARLDQLVAYAAKTSAYTATVADHTLNVTSGTFTLDLPAASTCTGQSLKVRNGGSGVVTVDGNSTELVEGVATFPLGPKSFVEFTSTGSAWILTGGTPDTGWRDVSADCINSWTTGNLLIRRQGNRVTAAFRNLRGGASLTTNCYVLPSGFAMTGSGESATGVMRDGFVTGSGVMIVGNGTTLIQFGNTFGGSSWSASNGLNGTMSWVCSADWPTSLPGSAA